MRRIYPALAAVLLAAGSAQAQQGKGFSALEGQVIEHTLPNGLRLILLPRHEAPVFSFATVANVGSVDEHVGITGLAHMFEHMAFKGTSRIGTKDFAAEQKAMTRADEALAKLKSAQWKKAPAEEIAKLEAEFKKAEEEAQAFVEPNEFSAILERAGAPDLNASTSSDFTTYQYSLPSNKLELWMSLESDRFIDPVLREFYKERDVVKEERNMRVDSSPIGRLLEEFISLSFNAHPYGQWGIGHVSDLNSFTRQEALELYKKYYVPSNLIVAVVGDIEPKATIAMAEKYFGRIKPGPDPEPVETVEPEQRSERRSVIYGEAQAMAVMGYHKPSATHPDEPVYDALSSIVSGGRTSRLYRSLIQEKKLATDAGGFSGFPGNKYPNLFVFYALPAPGHTNTEVLAAMDAELEKLATQPVSTEELNRVKAKAKSGLVQALGSNLGMAIQLAQQEALSGDWRNLFKSIDKINAVTPQDIQRVAAATFRKNNRTIAMLEPEPAKPAAAAPQGD